MRVLLLALLLFPTLAWGQVTYGTVGSTANGASTIATLTISNYTCTNSNTVLYLAACIRETTSTITTVTAPTYNGGTFTDMTPVTSPGSGTRAVTVSPWRLVAGSACDGSPHDITVTISTAKNWAVGVMSFTGVNTSSPNDTWNNTIDGALATDPDGPVITSETNDLVVGFAAARNSGTTLTAVSGQTDRFNAVSGNATPGSNMRCIGTTEPGAASVQHQWTTGGSTTEAAIVSVNLNQSSARRRSPPPGLLMRLLNWFLPSEAEAQQTQIVPQIWYYKDATNCPANVTNAKQDERCVETNDNDEWRCATPNGAGADPTKCDAASEWALMSGGGSGNATQFQGRTIESNAPSDGEVMTWIQSANEWRAMPPGAPVDVVTLTGNQTVTNKTFTSPTLNVASGGSMATTINGTAFSTVNAVTGVVDYGDTYAPSSPLSWGPNSVEVDGTGCTAPLTEVVNGSEPLRNFACADGGKFSMQYVLPLAYKSGAPLNFRLKARSIAGTSQVQAFDISGWCRGVNDTIDGNYSVDTGVTCTFTTGTAGNEIKQCNVDFTPEGGVGGCVGGDVLSVRARVNNALNNATGANTKILGGTINYPKRRDRE